MMNCWPIAPAATAPVPLAAALGPLVDGIGRDGYAQRALGALNAALPIGSWAVYRVWPDRLPQLHLSASCGVADTTRECFAAYADGLYRRDRSFDAVHAHRGAPAVLRMRAEQAPNREHRARIYERHGVVERVSVARVDADGSLLALNLYRHAHQGRYGDGEVAALAGAAPLLLAAVARHLDWSQPAPPDRRAALKAQCAALTEREVDVLERLLRGYSYDGIAADLGLSVPTVKTYRQRAFDRLGIHYKSELYARFMPAH